MNYSYCLVFITLLLVIEILSRLIYRFARKIPQLAWGVDPVENIRTGKRNNIGQFSVRTYGLYWQTSNYYSNGFKQTDSNGFRWKGYDVTKEKKEFRIIAYGGSTTFSNYFLPDPNDCWPHILERKLNSKSDKKYEVINAGLNYGMTPEILCHFIFEGSAFCPDLVILHGPGNDILPISVGDSTLDYRNTRQVFSSRGRKYEKLILNNCGIVRLIYAIWLRGSGLIQFEPEFSESVTVQSSRLTNQKPIAFENNVKTLVDICVQRGIRVVLIDFLLAPKESIESLKPGLAEGIIFATNEMNQIFRIIASSQPNFVHHIAESKFCIQKEDFGDTCHLYHRGEYSKAETIFNSIKELI